MDSWKEDSLSVLKELDIEAAKNPDREYLFALAELCFYEAERMDDQSREAMPLYTSSMVYAYKYLFDKGSKRLNPYHPGSRLACEIYNRSLAELLTYAKAKKFKLNESTHFRLLNGKIELNQKLSNLSWSSNNFNEIKVVYQYKVKGVDYQFRTYGIG